MMNEVVIASAVRTPIGSFLGSLASVPATRLGAAAISAALKRIELDPKWVEEVFMGNVLQAGLGQAPARQAALFAGLPDSVPCTTVNKVCASGMKAIALAAQAIRLGEAEIVVAGGMENMSGVPHYLPGIRNGQKLGNMTLIDGMVFDGLTDVYNQIHMGSCSELCAEEHSFSREQQDDFAIESYRRSAAAWEAGKFAKEVISVEVPQRKGDALIFNHDEEYKNVHFEKLRSLAPVFKKDGTITAANASTLNDGAAAVVLMSAKKAQELGIRPLARILGAADAAHQPEWFTTAPAKAVPIAVQRAGLQMTDIDYFELNEAFSVVGLANIKLLGLDAQRTNVNGGAVSLGHPLGASGARILVTLINVLEQNNAKYGAAGICNGGGGASAMVIEKL